ncbi:MAG: hypothetical protein RLY16_2705, partial [Bacteroidota bacterium]
PTRFDTRFSGLRRSSWYGKTTVAIYAVVDVVKLLDCKSESKGNTTLVVAYFRVFNGVMLLLAGWLKSCRTAAAAPDNGGAIANGRYRCLVLICC